MEDFIQNELPRFCPSKINTAIAKPNGNKSKSYCERLFDYSKFREQKGFDFINKAGLKSCPYCNTAYIFSLNRSKKASADLDHFYPKSKRPYFALTLYNLIPVCTFCNQRLKRDSEAPHLYPYEEEFEDNASFEYTHLYSNNYDPYLQNTNAFEVRVNVNSNSHLAKTIQSHKKLFHIKEIYKFHKNRVSRIAEMKRIFSEKLPEEFKRSFPDLFPNELSVFDEVEQTYFNHLTQDGEILSKFHKDIIEQINKEYEEL